MSAESVITPDVFAKYGMPIPKTDKVYVINRPPRKDCFAYLPEIGIYGEKCNALNRLYCKCEDCDFYKTDEEFKKGGRRSSGKRSS